MRSENSDNYYYKAAAAALVFTLVGGAPFTIACALPFAVLSGLTPTASAAVIATCVTMPVTLFAAKQVADRNQSVSDAVYDAGTTGIVVAGAPFGVRLMGS